MNERVFQRGIIGWRGEATLGGRVSAGFRFFVLIIIHTHTHTVDVFIFVRSIVPSIHPSVDASHVYNNKEWTETTPQLNPRARAFLFITQEKYLKITVHKRNIPKLHTRNISKKHTTTTTNRETSIQGWVKKSSI